MNAIFDRVKKANVLKADFDLSHERKLSADLGKLIPVLVQEVLPGDEFKINSETMIRFSPLVAPVMHRMNCYIHYFFVPNRIIWDHWEKFISQAEVLTVPNIDLNGVTIPYGSIGDYLGLPAGVGFVDTMLVNVLPLRAYVKIWNDFYRNSRVQNELPIGVETDANYLDAWCFSRNYETDYFTSGLPYAQKGTVAAAAAVQNDMTAAMLKVAGTSNAAANNNLSVADGILHGNTEHLYVDGGLSVDIQEIRRAEALQRVLEKLARTGDKYKDWLKSFFGVETSDSRLDMVEYLGGSKSPVIISEVLNTTGQMGTELAPEGMAQGTMTGHAINVGKSYDCYLKAEEHGWLMAIMSVLPESAYAQGIPRMFSRINESDYPLPEYANLGEQAILRKELYMSQDNEYNNSAFAYVPRYQEYRFNQNSVHGEFRNTLEYWHLARKFSELTPPMLNDTFLQTNPTDFSRIFAVTDIDETEQMYCQVYHHIEAKRPLPYNADPRI